MCIWPTQTQGLLINWTCWLLAGSAHDFTRKLFARKLQARLGHWVYTACAVLGLWCHAAGTIGKIPAWKNYRRQNPSRGKVPGLEIPAARNYWADPGISARDPGLRLALYNDTGLRLYHLWGIRGRPRQGRRMMNTSREQRKRRPEVYITEAQMAQVAKGRDPKRGEVPRG